MKHSGVLKPATNPLVRRGIAAVFLVCSLILYGAREAAAEPNGRIEFELGSEYNDYARVKGAPPRRSSSGGSVLRAVLLYLPNRVLDLFDIVRIDAGIGPAYGGMLRVSRYGQIGYRRVRPFSARLGLRGRRSPGVIENRGEGGFPWDYTNSPKRPVCAAEVGLGADLAILGGYGGVCFDELADFAAGFLLVDFKEDDLR